MLLWGGDALTGIQKRVEIGRPLLDVQHTKYFGLFGTSQINGEAAEVPIACEMWLNDASYTTANAIAALLGNLLSRVGEVDDLIEEGPQLFRTFPDCELAGFDQLGDILLAQGAGMPEGSYFVHVRFFWNQLTPGWD